MTIKDFQEKYNPNVLIKLTDDDKKKLFIRIKSDEQMSLPSIIESKFWEYGMPGQSTFGIEKNNKQGWVANHSEGRSKNFTEEEAMIKIDKILQSLCETYEEIKNNNFTNINNSDDIIKYLFPRKYFQLLFPNKLLGIFCDDVMDYAYEQETGKDPKQSNWFAKSNELTNTIGLTEQNVIQKNKEYWDKYTSEIVKYVPKGKYLVEDEIINTSTQFVKTKTNQIGYVDKNKNIKSDNLNILPILINGESKDMKKDTLIPMRIIDKPTVSFESQLKRIITGKETEDEAKKWLEENGYSSIETGKSGYDIGAVKDEKEYHFEVKKGNPFLITKNEIEKAKNDNNWQLLILVDNKFKIFKFGDIELRLSMEIYQGNVKK